jgi:hypothetical protein
MDNRSIENLVDRRFGDENSSPNTHVSDFFPENFLPEPGWAHAHNPSGLWGGVELHGNPPSVVFSVRMNNTIFS